MKDIKMKGKRLFILKIIIFKDYKSKNENIILIYYIIFLVSKIDQIHGIGKKCSYYSNIGKPHGYYIGHN